MQTIISIVISLALSFSLISGVVQLSQFAFYVCVIMNVLSWIGMLLGMVKDEVSAGIRRTFWILLLPSIFYVYALIFSGHPMLGASSFMVQFLIVATAFRKEAKPA
ncbi:hypothetical protein [Pseudomonas aeruginosa]|uniref:hypothetical protein n=1 Tax=Pseudomonas aeruginosa TaxID=287 RepID=UPI002885DAD1|nr:hypothetical protein [Pseudomonas aeruginosa]MDT1043484.1 hypothetical protein [Pseudomonas aeruginosa]